MDFWVFRASVSADAEAEQRASEKSFNGEFSADRTTETWKIRAQTEGEFSEEEFELSDGGVIVSDTRDWEVSGQVVRSLGAHWGASIRGSGEASTFRNEDRVVSVAPGIEYNVFPYAESSRRLLTLTYEIGVTDVLYEEETLFDVTEETLIDHSLEAQYRALATDYQYELSVGFSYTFGSIFNNVVNPRFQDRRGGGFFF